MVLKNWSSSVVCQNTPNEVRGEIFFFFFFPVAMTYLLQERSWVALDRIVSPSLLHYLMYIKLRADFNQLYLGCHNYASCAGEIQLP